MGQQRTRPKNCGRAKRTQPGERACAAAQCLLASPATEGAPFGPGPFPRGHCSARGRLALRRRRALACLGGSLALRRLPVRRSRATITKVSVAAAHQHHRDEPPARARRYPPPTQASRDQDPRGSRCRPCRRTAARSSCEPPPYRALELVKHWRAEYYLARRVGALTGPPRARYGGLPRPAISAISRPAVGFFDDAVGLFFDLVEGVEHAVRQQRHGDHVGPRSAPTASTARRRHFDSAHERAQLGEHPLQRLGHARG